MKKATTAGAEVEVIEQRKNSWSGHLRSALTATIGATSGAVLSNIDGRASEAAVNAIFNDDSRHGRGHEHGHDESSRSVHASCLMDAEPSCWIAISATCRKSVTLLRRRS